MYIYGPGNIAQVRDMNLPALPVDTTEKVYQIQTRSNEPNIRKWLKEMDKLPKIRASKVNRIRRKIESGEYPLEQKLNQAMDNLLGDLLSS